MRSVADALRGELWDRLARLPASARIDLAFRLAEDDVQAFCHAQGADRDTALRRLRAGRHAGRRPSACAGQAP